MNDTELPICYIPMGPQELANYNITHPIITFDERVLVQKIIEDTVGGDCLALTIALDGSQEIIFNNYKDENLSFKESIMNDIVRDTIIKNPHGNLLVHLYQHNLNAQIDIYMYRQYPFKIQIIYNQEEKIFTVRGFVSSMYKEKFC